MDPRLGRLQRALHGRYAVEHELGRGGMATVFLGHDLRLQRRVAIKVFEEDGGLIAAGERFLREIRIAAQLQHPNILPVHDSGEGEGLVYYIMPYVAGGSLRERLEREGPLPVADAVRIGREVAEALDHAHRAGIVHRDIKPDNIMLADGVAVVADFGIARALEQGGGKVTETGLAIGTPTYMSPEQAAASPQVDGRTDLYALGCVVYEMLAGSPPFGGPTAQVVMARHATDAPPPLQTVRTVPPGLETTIRKALAKLPGDRWASGKAMAEALTPREAPNTVTGMVARSPRIPLVAAAVVILVVVAAFMAKGNPRKPLPDIELSAADSVPRIGILPFVLIGDSAQAHYALGLTEALITALVKVGGVHVPSQGGFEGRGQDPVAFGQELGVQNVVTATVQIAGSTLRVLPKMTRVADGSIVWSERMDGDIADVFAMQDGITARIVEALRIHLSPVSRAMLARGAGTTNQEAYNLYLLGRSYFLRGDPASLLRAVEFFKDASSRDSGFAEPLVGLLDAYDLIENVMPGQYQVSGAAPSALLHRALAIDSTNGDAYMHLAYQLRRACDSAGADRAWQDALRYRPGSTLIRREFAIILSETGRRPEALAMIREAARIAPTVPWVLAVLSHQYSVAGMHDSALAVSDRAISLDSTQWVPHAVRGFALTGLGRFQEAIRSLQAAGQLGGASHALTTAGLGMAHARAGQREEAVRVARLLGVRHGRGEAGRTHPAMVYLALGDRESALEWLARPPQSTDYQHRDSFWDPAFDSLRSDPRFISLAARPACTSRS